MVDASSPRDDSEGELAIAERWSLQRDSAADARDSAATARDERAVDRDRAQAKADVRAPSLEVGADHTASTREAAIGPHVRLQTSDQRRVHSLPAAADRQGAVADRKQRGLDVDQHTLDRAAAAADRSCAAADRVAAASDRVAAAYHRAHLVAELRRAQRDQLTGAFGLGLGIVKLEVEVNRARRGTGRLILACLDVDGLKAVNDCHGHAAGDALLRNMVGAICRHLRSYDVVVRVGGDEFVCALSDCVAEDARRRFEEIQATFQQVQPDASFTVGFVALGAVETLEQLTQRGDAALYEAKRGRLNG